MNEIQEELISVNKSWQNEWIDMPEFVQDKKTEYKSLIIRFDCEQDFTDFQKLIGQKLTKKTKSIWFPFKSHWGNNPNEVYRDEP
jgi:hypothetical protein